MKRETELLRVSENLLIHVAMERTRIKNKLRRAVVLVMCDGLSVIKAAHRVQRHRNNVYRAIWRVKRELAKLNRNQN